MNHSDRFCLTEVAFEQLLYRLDPDRDRAGEKYELLRAKLVKFFEWRGSPWPDEQADECLDRLIRRVSQGDTVEKVEAFVWGVARLVLQEGWREQRKERGRLAAVSVLPLAAEPRAIDAFETCLDECLARLPPGERDLIIEYYRHSGRERIGNRLQLAVRHGLRKEVLRGRVHRIRARIGICLRQCVGERSRDLRRSR